MRGEQLLNLGNAADAKLAFEVAIATGNPQLVPARWMLANIYLSENRPDDALALLNPVETSFPYQYEIVAGLGFAHYLKGDYAAAASYLVRARDLRAPDTTLLNALGEIHVRIGDKEKAREAFERSLELDSEQPGVREQLASLR